MADVERAEGECPKHGPYSTPHCRECDLDIIANVESEEPTMDVEWQDIATAPKDGSGILVIDMTAEKPEAGCAWFLFDKWSAVDPDGQPVFEPEFYHAMVWASPTHWMPLPTPPSSKGTNNGR